MAPTRHIERDTTKADADLLPRLRSGDRAFGELYQHAVAALTRYVAARLPERDRDAIDDLIQDAYCTALAEPYLLQGTSSARCCTWPPAPSPSTAGRSDATCAPRTPSTKTAPPTCGPRP